MDQRTTAAKAWADAESALRAKYHGAGLYVRKQVYQRPDGVTMVVGGWAYLDGDPAMIPTDLDLPWSARTRRAGSSSRWAATRRRSFGSSAPT